MRPFAVAFAVFQPSSRGACDRYYLFAIGCVFGLYWLFDAEGQIKDAARPLVCMLNIIYCCFFWVLGFRD
jgi:hypothetical protein